MVDRSGIESAGPALVLFGGAWLLFLLVWVLIKAGLRDPAVVFYVTERGAGIMPSARQRIQIFIQRRHTACAFYIVAACT